MDQGVYEIIALAARYGFAALMVLIVLRAWRLTIVDSRRAQTLRRLSPETGLSGELIVLEGDGQARRGMRYPVIREGMIGSSRAADIRVRHPSVRRKHAWFQLTDGGLALRAHEGAAIKDRRTRRVGELLLKDGDVFQLGRVRLMLVLAESTVDDDDPRESEGRDALFDVDPASAYDPFDEEDFDDSDAFDEDDFDDDFDGDGFDPDRMFQTQPVLRKRKRRGGN